MMMLVYHPAVLRNAGLRTAPLSQLNRAFSTLNQNSFTTTVRYKPSHVYSVVADVESYSKFVPWCTKSKVVEELSPREKLADLTVGFYGVTEETFRSHVILDPYRSVTALASSELYSKSPLKRLKNVWTFEPVGDNETRVSMELEFEFHNPWYTKLTSHFLKRISNLAMSSFIARCALVKPPALEELNVEREQQPQAAAGATTPAAEQAIVDHSFRGVQDTFRSLASCAYFEEYEIEILAHEFQRLTEDSAGRLSKFALGKFLQIQDKSLLDAIFNGMDVDKNGSLTLREFVRGLSLITRGSPQEKRFVWFKNAPDEAISKEDLMRATACTLVVRDVLARLFASNASISFYERPDVAAARLVAPVFRNGMTNTRALERLFASL
jgi:coenzyme Q-binding protein COQ10